MGNEDEEYYVGYDALEKGGDTPYESPYPPAASQGDDDSDDGPGFVVGYDALDLLGDQPYEAQSSTPSPSELPTFPPGAESQGGRYHSPDSEQQYLAAEEGDG